MRPPIRSSRSRPPTPIAWEIPAPSRSMRQTTCCSPVPEAPTRPIVPRRYGVREPERHAVQDRGPAVRAHEEQVLLHGQALELQLVRDRHVVAEEEHVQTPLERFSASAVACRPGVEMSTRLAAGASATACAIVVGAARTVEPAAVSVALVSSVTPRASAASAAVASSAATARMRSFGRAVAASSSSRPAEFSTSRFGGVAKATQWTACRLTRARRGACGRRGPARRQDPLTSCEQW